MAASSFLSQLLLRRLTSTQDGLPDSSNQGVTLVECIVAIAAIALASAMIAPPLFIAAATRLQNQRAEQALQIAQGEVDRIRFLVNRKQHTVAHLPVNSTTGAAGFAATAAPTRITSYVKTDKASCPNQYTNQQFTPYLALQVDVNGDCKGDFIVQEFRTEGRTPVSEGTDPITQPVAQRKPSSFCFMVRVYAAAASDYLQQGGTLQITPASLQFTNGEGNQKIRPLAVLTTPVIWSDQSFSSQEARDSGSICPS